MMKVKFEVLPFGLAPSRAHDDDAGVDLCARSAALLMPGEHSMVPTGVRMAIPSGYEGQLRPRSGLAAKKGVSVLNSPGTIDSGYRGEIGVILVNHGKFPHQVQKGDKIAQLVFARVEYPVLEQVDELPLSERGQGGFGSTDGYATLPALIIREEPKP